MSRLSVVLVMIGFGVDAMDLGGTVWFVERACHWMRRGSISRCAYASVGWFVDSCKMIYLTG